jgi:hypothetical protein
MTDTLQRLFGSSARLKLLRLFLFNPKEAYSAREAADRSREKPTDVRRELTLLGQAGLIRKSRRAGVQRFQLKPDYPYIGGLQQLLLNIDERKGDIYDLVRRAGTIKLLVISGILVGEWEDGQIDLFVVGDRVKESSLRNQVKKLESELGRELRFAYLPTEQFLYRQSMNDRLIKDVFDYPHSIIHDKLQIGLK